MSFTRKNADLTPIVDTVFVVADAARKDKEENHDLVKNATLGSLYDEEGNLVAFDSVFNHYDEIDHKVKAKYASSFTGNPNYREEIYKWLTDYLASHKSLTLERPKSSSFTVTIDSEEHLRIDGASIKKDYFESFFKGTKKGNYYDSHFKRIIEFVYKHYHPNHTSEEIANKLVFIIDEINRGEAGRRHGSQLYVNTEVLAGLDGVSADLNLHIVSCKSSGAEADSCHCHSQQAGNNSHLFHVHTPPKCICVWSYGKCRTVRWMSPSSSTFT